MSDGNGFVGRDAFLGPMRRRYTTVDVAGFGQVRIQSLTEREKSDYETSVVSTKGGSNFVRRKLEESRRRLIILCLVDGNGATLLTDKDMRKLEDMDGAVASVIHDACRKHCGFDDGDIEELVKNSERITVSDSPTG